LTLSIRDWLYRNLKWLALVLLALWWPPVLTLLAAHAGLVPNSGFPRLFDPSTVCTLLEMFFLTWGTALLFLDRAAAGWVALAWSRVPALLRLMWMVVSLWRLNGGAATLQERIVWESVAFLIVSVAVLAWLRPSLRQRWP
jgi:hypothetical protein